MMEVVSPTRVAAPCRFEDTAIDRIIDTGEISSFLHTASATGAIMSTVATLSINADTAPENRDIRMMTHMTFGHLSRMMSASRFGIFDSMKNQTTSIVPPIIMRTFQLMTDRMYSRFGRRIPTSMKAIATPQIA